MIKIFYKTEADVSKDFKNYKFYMAGIIQNNQKCLIFIKVLSKQNKKKRKIIHGWLRVAKNSSNQIQKEEK